VARLKRQVISTLAGATYKLAQSASLRKAIFNAIRHRRIEVERFRQMEECDFLAYIFLNREKSKSQILQDLWVNYELGEKRGKRTVLP
jgi:hypothetical protein